MATTKNKSLMGSCISEFKHKHPSGRKMQGTKMTKKNVQKQRVAACLSKTGLSEGLSFKEFLTEMNQIGGVDLQKAISSLPIYKDLLRNPETRALARNTVRSFVSQNPGIEANQAVMNKVVDMLHNVEAEAQPGLGANIGDWAGDQELKDRRRREKEQSDADMAQSEVKHDSRGRLKPGARSGLDFMNKVKQKRAAQDLLGQGNVGSEANRADLERKASMDAPGEHTWDPEYGGPTDQNPTTKRNRGRDIAFEEFEKAGFPRGQKIERGAESKIVGNTIRQRLMNELDKTKNGASTYYFGYKKQWESAE